MKRTLYIRDEKTGSPMLRRLLIILLVIALVGGSAIGYYFVAGERRAATILDDFNQALAEERYQDAIELYRLTQSKALTDSWAEQYRDKYKAALAEMEKITGIRIAQIKGKLLLKKQLTAAELAFSEQMAEAAAVGLVNFLRGLCSDYLIGKADLGTLENAFTQLSDLNNLKDSIGNLPEQFARMTDAQPLIMAALADQKADRYWKAWQGFADILADTDMAGYVHDQTRLYQDKCEQEMFQPLLDEARILMDGGRFLSARTALEKMAEVYPDDKAIQADRDECASHLPASFADYSGSIEIITIKPLIVRPDLAFDGDAYADAANDTMLTVSEFRSLLSQLYTNNYILIDSSRIYTSERKRANLQLPAGKKPLVLVLEGYNYYAARRLTGNCWDLALDEGGEVGGLYQDADGKMVIDREAEAIGILDLFVADHPDFSHDGAKGTISLTGYEGIFGKVTDADQLDDRNKALQDNGFAPADLTAGEIAANRLEVQEIIDRLKHTGWLFASSTYGFIDVSGNIFEKLKADTEKWMDQVGRLTGPVAFLNYPSGSFLSGSDERAIWLREQGFILFGGLGTTAYLYAGDGYIYVDKTPINGFTLRNAALYKLGRMIDADTVYDEVARITR